MRLGGLTPSGKNFYLSFKSKDHGQRIDKIGFIGRIQINCGLLDSCLAISIKIKNAQTF